MQFYRQDAKRNCGQIAVAAITERSVEEIERIVGHNHGTPTRQLIRALHACGFNSAPRCKPARYFKAIPALCIAQIHNARPGWHWVAIGDGKVWDGCAPRVMSLADYAKRMAERGDRFTSFLPITAPV